MILVGLALATELPDVGEWDRIRVDAPNYPGAITTSAYGSVVLEKPTDGTPWHIEEPPSTDDYFPDEGVAALAAQPYLDRHGGAGVKIAVFDVQWFLEEAYEDELPGVITHDCETQQSCDAPMDTERPRYSWEEGSHGVACAQIVRDLAPEAELHLVRVNGLTTFENAVDWATRNDIDIISMSMSFFNNSFHDGTGPLNEAAGRAAAGGIALVDSVGNYATEHWIGDWQDKDLDRDMDFPWGSSYLPVYLGSGGNTIYVSWEEWGQCGRTDLDAYVYSYEGELIGVGDATQNYDDACDPIERFTAWAPETDWYYLRVWRRAGPAGVRVSVFARDAQAYEYNGGSTADPASSPTTFSVGAVKAIDYLQNEAESYSSMGPTHGGVAKPDIAGPDGLTTAVYGVTGFYGTSASTPAVAAALALLMGEDPDLTPDEAKARLVANAIGGKATWQEPDLALGPGKARLPDPEVDGSPGICGANGGAAEAALLLMWLRPRRRRPI